MNTYSIHVQHSLIARQSLSSAVKRIARAIATRWDGELSNAVVISVATQLDAMGPQWSHRIDHGYSLDTVRALIATELAR